MPYSDNHCVAGMRLADGMSKAAVAFLAKQLAAENTHSGKFASAVNLLHNVSSSVLLQATCRTRHCICVPSSQHINTGAWAQHIDTQYIDASTSKPWSMVQLIVTGIVGVSVGF